MKSADLESLSLDSLLTLYEQVRQILTKRIESEKVKLEQQLARIAAGTAADRRSENAPRGHARRYYPPVHPKYRNPSNSSETWAGRGKQPRWLVSQLKAGKKIDDFLIESRGGGRQRKKASK